MFNSLCNILLVFSLFQLSMVFIFEVNLENKFWGGKPHSFVKLKLQSSQATLISRCHFEKY